MAAEKPSNSDDQSVPIPEPRGFREHVRGLASEYAHEQGWGLNEQERKATPREKQPSDGGTNYEYGARDFGDTPVDTGDIKPSPEAVDELFKE
jgi:hypothetical protein